MANEYIIGRNINAQAAIEQAGLKLSDDGKVSNETFHHEEIMDQMIKVIEFTKMDKKIRSVLLLRLIHGYSIQRMQIYLFLHGYIMGNSHDELMAIEEEGKRLVMETLSNHSMQDIISTVNAKTGVIASLQNELTKPTLGLS